MPIDLDRYYTPEHVAVSILERADISSAPRACADSTCGTGRLLDAANMVFGKVDCVGVDRDVKAISQLRLRRPTWHLVVANLLGSRARIRDFSKSLPSPVDLLVLNPPFSHGKSKSTDIYYDGRRFKGTVAMAHLLQSLEIFNPENGAVAIVPESLLYSNTDDLARNILQEKYSLKKISDLKNCTFRGARVNASAIQVCRSEFLRPLEKKSQKISIIEVSIVRGSLPVHIMRPERPGTPFLHSTGIRKVICGGGVEALPTTSSSAKGRLEGWSILIPRVGLPDRKLMRVVYLEQPVQLSDCVIALTFDSQHSAEKVQKIIASAWGEFYDLYKGTGAKYITISRLTEWFSFKGITAIG